MTLFAYIIIASSFFASGWYARKLYDYLERTDWD